MKAISLTQPWASLMALGCKTIETRCWPTKERGYIAIHAAKKMTTADKDFAARSKVVVALEAARLIRIEQKMPAIEWLEDYHNTNANALPRGEIVAVVHLSHCEETNRVFDVTRPLDDSRVLWSPRLAHPFAQKRLVPANERYFGDYRVLDDNGKQRYAFWTTFAVPLLQTVPCTGALGLWDIPDEHHTTLMLRLSEQGVELPPPAQIGAPGRGRW